jgi:ABC-type transporter Mla maintaining outer membrane lipid asymmetry ATPase subunit MlaF
MEPAPTNRPVIEMTDVAISAMHEPTLVAEQVNWAVNAGDFWVIGGLQGSGKSDLLFLTGGLMPPARGTYRLFGELMPIFDDARLPTRLRLGLVFEEGQLLHQLTVWENIALPLRYHRNLSAAQAQSLAANFIEATELGPWTDNFPSRLGRNWRKRTALARALTLDPEILLVDNPLTGLDLRHVNWWLDFLDLLAKGHPLLHKRPMTLVVTASDLRPWEGRARQFALLQDQRLTILGSWAQMKSAGADLVQELITLNPARMNPG